MTELREPTGGAEPDKRVSLAKSDKSEPSPENELVVQQGLGGATPPSRGRRVAAAATTARDRTIRQLVAVLVPLIKATRIPLLTVALAAAVPAVTVIAIALLRPGPDDWFWLVLAAVGLLLAGWLGLRRRQLLTVAQDPAALTAALASVVSGHDMWDQLVRNVSTGKVGVAVVRRSRPLRILGQLWRGVQMAGVLTQITDRPELAPLLPGRLRGLWFLGIACLVASLVLGLAVLVVGLLYLLGA